ncbi:MAG: glycosyltransferase [Candidatus Krumholzibacteria bacterium]|jgi:glycosyltransferase involved in cell wall biosynthesis|nr:glycosyltransferase [Candidatus Krumholzibacteria bacterium]
MDSPVFRQRVTILCSTLVTGGAEMVVRALALGLAGYGIMPRIVCIREPGTIGEEIKNGGIAVLSGISGGRRDIGAVVKLARILAAERDSILLCLDHHDAIFAGVLASRMAGQKHRVLCVHSTGLWNRKGTFSFTDRMALPHFERVVALAENHARYLCDDGGMDPGKIVLIRNGVDTRKFRPESDACAKASLREELGIPRDDLVVTMAAAMRPEKNHMMLVCAASRLLGGDPGYTFLMAGDGAEAPAIRKRAAGLGIEGKIRFLGVRRDMERIFSVTDVSVLCSHPVVETLPLSILEAMSSGAAVVSTRVGSIPEMMEDGREGILIESGDVEALARSLQSLKKDPGLRMALGENARKRVEKDFSESGMLKAYAELFSRIAEGGKEGR